MGQARPGPRGNGTTEIITIRGRRPIQIYHATSPLDAGETSSTFTLPFRVEGHGETGSRLFVARAYRDRNADDANELAPVSVQRQADDGSWQTVTTIQTNYGDARPFEGEGGINYRIVNEGPGDVLCVQVTDPGGARDPGGFTE